jgi:hypothetical protein
MPMSLLYASSLCKPAEYPSSSLISQPSSWFLVVVVVFLKRIIANRGE